MIKFEDKPVLLLIDLQKGFLEEEYWGGSRNNPDMEKNILRLLEYWRKKCWPIVHFKHDSGKPNSPLNPKLPGNDWMDEFRPKQGEIFFTKYVNSAFIETGLQEWLWNHNLNTLVMVGLTSGHCISTTARMAENLEFRTYVVSDATATFDRKGMDGKIYPAELVHEISLANLNGEFATIVDTASIIESDESD